MTYVILFFMICSFLLTLTLGEFVLIYLIRKSIIEHKMLKGDK